MDAESDAAIGRAADALGAAAREKLATEKIVPLRFAGSRELIQLATTHPTTPSGKIELAPLRTDMPAPAPD